MNIINGLVNQLGAGRASQHSDQSDHQKLNNMKRLFIGSVLCIAFLFCIQAGYSQANKNEKRTSFSGNISRSDRKEPVAGARIILLDEKKSEKQDNSVETRTDKDGNFSFQDLKPGKYTISIQAAYDRAEDVPCALLMGKISEPNSSVMVVSTKEGKRVEQIFIKGFTVKEGKEIKKDFDLVCQSMFGK